MPNEYLTNTKYIDTRQILETHSSRVGFIPNRVRIKFLGLGMDVAKPDSRVFIVAPGYTWS
jgi:hypothetical protein